MSTCNNCNKELCIGDVYDFGNDNQILGGSCLKNDTTTKKYITCDDCGEKLFAGDTYYLDEIGDVICTECWYVPSYTLTEEFIEECYDTYL